MLLVSGSMWTAIAMLWIHGLDLRYPAPFIGNISRTINREKAQFYLRDAR